MPLLKTFTDIWRGINTPSVGTAPKAPSIKQGFSSAGLSEGWTSIKRAAPSAAAAAIAPSVAASGIMRTSAGIASRVGGQATKTALKNLGQYTLAHPINSLKIGAIGTVGGIVAYNAVKENPKIVSEGVPAVTGFLSDLGKTGGEISKSSSFGEAYGHLRDFTTQHPIGSIVGASGLIAAGGAIAANLVSGALTRDKLEDVKQAIIGAPSSSGEDSGDGYMPTTASYEIVPDNTPQKRIARRSARRKSKSINRSPITIRNYNILGVSRHGKYC